MQIVRTIVWVLLLFSLLAFSFFNWKSVNIFMESHSNCSKLKKPLTKSHNT